MKLAKSQGFYLDEDQLHLVLIPPDWTDLTFQNAGVAHMVPYFEKSLAICRRCSIKLGLHSIEEMKTCVTEGYMQYIQEQSPEIQAL